MYGRVSVYYSTTSPVNYLCGGCSVKAATFRTKLEKKGGSTVLLFGTVPLELLWPIFDIVQPGFLYLVASV